VSDIQQARDVLAKWRDAEPLDIAMFGPLDEPLIVGTAGNPDLLDAIDAMLREASADIAQYGNQPDGLWSGHKRIAAAIIAADERMTS
jgi:hypothetical protein